MMNCHGVASLGCGQYLKDFICKVAVLAHLLIIGFTDNVGSSVPRRVNLACLNRLGLRFGGALLNLPVRRGSCGRVGRKKRHSAKNEVGETHIGRLQVSPDRVIVCIVFVNVGNGDGVGVILSLKDTTDWSLAL